MKGPGNLKLFSGVAAFDARAILHAASHQDVAAGLGAVQPLLPQAPEKADLSGLQDAIDAYRRLVERGPSEAADGLKRDIAGRIASLPSLVWRKATLPLLDPNLVDRLRAISYLNDILPEFRVAIADIVDTVGPEVACRILEVLSDETLNMRSCRYWLGTWSRILSSGTVHPFLRPRLLESMKSRSTFNNVKLLLEVASNPAFGEVLNWQEGVYPEEAVTANEATVIVWKQKEPLDIGLDGDLIKGDKDLIASLIKAAGAIESSLRRRAILVVSAPKITERARCFFFTHHPGGVLILRNEEGFTKYELGSEATSPSRVEKVTTYDHEWNPIEETLNLLTVPESELLTVTFLPAVAEETPAPESPRPSGGGDVLPSDSDTLPWTKDVREFLYRVWPEEISGMMNIKRVTSPKDFVRRAHQDIRHAHRIELFSNLKKLAPALSEEFATGGKMALLASKAGNSMSHADLAEVVRFAARAVGILPPLPSSNGRTAESRPGETKTPETRSHANGTTDSIQSAIAKFDEELETLERTVEGTDPLGERTIDKMRQDLNKLAGAYQTRLWPWIVDSLDELSQEEERVCDGFFARLEALERAIETKVVVRLTEDQRQRIKASVQDLSGRLEKLEAMILEFEPQVRGALESDSARSYADAYPKIAAKASEIQREARSLKDRTSRLRAEHPAAEDEPMSSVEAQIERILVEVARRVTNPLQELQDLEDSLQPSVPAIKPPPRPQISGRPLQIDETTPRRILEVLIEVPQDLYETANSYPELALLAPDHEVYGRLFGILDAKKRHGKGLYVEYGSSFFQRTAGYVPAEEGKISEGSILYAFDLSSVDAESFEKRLREPELYHLHKFDYLLSLVQMLKADRIEVNRDQAVLSARRIFIQNHLNRRQRGSEHLLSIIRDELTNPTEIGDVFIERLTQRVPRADVLRVAEKFFKSLGDYYEQTKKITVDYTKEEYERFLISNYLMNGSMLNEDFPQGAPAVEEALLAGKPIGGIAPVLAHAGWIKKAAGSWARQHGNTSSFAWNKRLTQARLFSTPDGSYLLFTPAKVEAAVKYLETRSPSGIKIPDELTGQPIPLIHQGRGYDLLHIAHIPVHFWYSTFLDRLDTLGRRPSPALDLVDAVLEKKGPNLDSVWREIVGLLMADGPQEPTCQGLQERVAVWAFSEKKRLERFSQIQKFLPGGNP